MWTSIEVEVNRSKLDQISTSLAGMDVDNRAALNFALTFDKRKKKENSAPPKMKMVKWRKKADTREKG